MVPGGRRERYCAAHMTYAFLRLALGEQRCRKQAQDFHVVGFVSERGLTAGNYIRMGSLLLQAQRFRDPERIDFRCVRRRGSARTEQAL